jgi:hypothetical protein
MYSQTNSLYAGPMIGADLSEVLSSESGWLPSFIIDGELPIGSGFVITTDGRSLSGEYKGKLITSDVRHIGIRGSLVSVIIGNECKLFSGSPEYIGNLITNKSVYDLALEPVEEFTECAINIKFSNDDGSGR